MRCKKRETGAESYTTRLQIKSRNRLKSVSSFDEMLNGVKGVTLTT